MTESMEAEIRFYEDQAYTIDEFVNLWESIRIVRPYEPHIQELADDHIDWAKKQPNGSMITWTRTETGFRPKATLLLSINVLTDNLDA